MVAHSKVNYCGKCKACVDAGDDGVDIVIPLPGGNYCHLPVVTWHCKARNRVYILKCSVCAHNHLIVLYVGETGANLMDRTRWNRKPNKTTFYRHFMEYHPSLLFPSHSLFNLFEVFIVSDEIPVYEQRRAEERVVRDILVEAAEHVNAIQPGKVTILFTND